MEIGLLGIFKFIAALVFVLALMGGLALVLKKAGFGQTGLAGRGGKRLKLVEVLPLDARRKAVILECDDEQHLIIMGPAGETLVKNNISKRIVSHDTAIKDAA
jgi:flagellar protein FliO/FliZ